MFGITPELINLTFVYNTNFIVFCFTFRSDEWIPMNSSRLRPIQLAKDNSLNSSSRMYKEGERCMAKWTDSRKFPATVRRVLENGISFLISL